jgi:iron complex outermembrane recepter protein
MVLLLTAVLTLTGVVVDSTNDSPIPGATVFVVETGYGTVSDDLGRFVIRDRPSGHFTLRIDHVSYSRQEFSVDGSVTDLLVRLVPDILDADEVVVFATTGTAARYQAAQVFDSESIQASMAPGLGEMLDGAPGVAMRSFGPVPSRPVIRGLDGDRILVLENGERMGDLAETAADHAVGLDMLALDRVEIVRGPASLLYGSSAIGGVVNLFNEDIPRGWETGSSGAAMVHGASVNRLGALSTRYRQATDRFATSLRFSARNSAEMMTPAGNLPGTFQRAYSGALGMAVKTPAGRMGASIATMGSSYGLPEILDDPGDSVEIRLRRTNARIEGFWNLDGFLESVDLRVVGTQYDHDEVEIELRDGEPDEDLELSFRQISLGGTLTARHRATGVFSGGSVGISGYARSMAVGGEESLTPDSRSFNIAAFGLEEILLSRTVSLSFGARIEHQSLSVHPNERFVDAAGRRRSTTFSASSGLNVRPNRTTELGFQIARAFRAPRLEELYSDAPHLGAGAYEVGNPDLKNEVSTGIDGFLSGSRGGLTFELSAFSNHIRDFVIYRPTGTTDEASGLPIIIYEADEALLVGGEARLASRIHGPISAELVFDYVRGSRVSETVEPLPFMPPVRSRVTATYESGAWAASVTTRLAAAQNRVAPDEEPTPGYALLGADIRYRIGGAHFHTVGLRLDNLTDRLYRDHLSRIEERDAPMPGRNLNLTYRWIF